jgi:translation initiation factor IF-1
MRSKNQIDNILTCIRIDRSDLTLVVQEEFEDTKGGIRIRKSKKNKQHNG